jgi:hypothetical protein
MKLGLSDNTDVDKKCVATLPDGPDRAAPSTKMLCMQCQLYPPSVQQQKQINKCSDDPPGIPENGWDRAWLRVKDSMFVFVTRFVLQ